jgi:hypothetical protein
MTQKRGLSSNYPPLPDNPDWVEFPRSDGDSSSWPRNTTYIVDDEDQINFMRPIPLDERGPSTKWRIDIAAALAVALKWPGIPVSQGSSSVQLISVLEGRSYVLKSFPSGYQLYDHQKGQKDNPRHDIYLCGSLCFFFFVAFQD